jgi:hypothetical protein
LPLVVSSHPSFLPDLPVHRSCLLSYSLIFSAACKVVPSRFDEIVFNRSRH